MLIPKVHPREFEKFGFRRCKGSYGKNDCYYLCVARGCEMIFVSPVMFAINPWKDDDPRIHSRANCKYSDSKTALDILYLLIKEDMVQYEPG